MTTATTTSVTSYFFIFDFYHNRLSTEESNLRYESVIYFYPNSDEFKAKKEDEWRFIIGLMHFVKCELFSSYVRELNYKKSLVAIEHYGRHCAFLVLPRDRFTMDEAKIHLTHTLQLFHTFYGTLNHVQAAHPEITQMTLYLKNKLTPIVEHVFNENRSIRNLFSVVDYSPLKRNSKLCLLQVKHFLSHLKTEFEIQDGFFAYDKRVLYSTFDIDTTYYIQVILGSKRILPITEESNTARVETQLIDGVSIIKIHILPPPSLGSMSDAVNNASSSCSDSETFSDAIEPTLPNSCSLSSTPKVYEDPSISSADVTDFETDQTGDTSAQSKTDETDSLLSPTRKEKSNSNNLSSTSTSYSPQEDSLTDPPKEIYQRPRPRGGTLNDDFEDFSRPGRAHHDQSDRLDKVVFQTVMYDSDDCGGCNSDDIIALPPKPILPTFQLPRHKTITNASDAFEAELTNSQDQSEGPAKWGDVPEKNDESEREEFILYIQRNSRMAFAGIVKKRALSKDYLTKLWKTLAPEMADLDANIEVIPFAGQSSNHSIHIQFQFNDTMHHAQYERFVEKNKFYYKIPSSDGACMAFCARNKKNIDPERKMVGLSRGKNSVSITCNIPDRVIYSCRSYKETR